MSNNEIYFYIDESQDANQGDKGANLYLCVSLILSEYKNEFDEILKKTNHFIKNDQFMGINKRSLNKILHYNDDNDDVKNKVVETIRMLFFKSYISKIEFGAQSYDTVYYILLKSLIKDRIIKHKERTIIIRYEENTKITKKGMELAVKEVMDAIEKENKHVVMSPPTLEEVTKNDLLVSIPDYTLGLFLTYLREKDRTQPRSFKINRFEKIRSKIRLYIDLNIPKYLSRKSFDNL